MLKFIFVFGPDLEILSTGCRSWLAGGEVPLVVSVPK